ncbi:hypothetical protein OOK29_22570 [Streptomyces phaeochromogenes]|uniref:hypothetical protein n=1 Tax=Streptomyces TaxID=1883 RepID=UPI00225B7D67|nr:hypothetical protein [Streptomyces phaeochromogenes]MCX5600943.1 hypothetical protein [Streptomyces phaeochromogenes]
MALPALAGVAGWLAARFPDDVFDVHAEVLSGFLGALATIDLDRPRVLVRLRWAAYRAGFAALCEALDAPMPMAGAFRSTPPKAPWGHPDLVLAEAVRQSVLTRTEADLIGATRLEDTLVADWADRNRMTPEATYKARWRAERRLVAFLREQAATTDPDDPVASQAVSALAPAAPTLRTTRRLPSVTPLSRGDRTRPPQKSAAAVSNPSPDSGLLERGESTPALAPDV